MRNIVSDREITQIHDGDWLVVLYDEECSHCKTLVPEVIEWAIAEPKARVIFLSLTSNARTNQGLVVIPDKLRDRLVAGHLDDSHSWFARTPALIALNSGIVVREEWPKRFVDIAGLGQK